MLTTVGRKAGSRWFPFAIQAVCMVVAVVLVLPAPSRVPATLSASALSAITVSAADTNGNGLLDTVVVNFTANLTAPGLFEVSAELDVPLFGAIATDASVRNGTTLNVTAGPHPFAFALPGQLIPDASRDGPYNLTVAMVELVPGQPPGVAFAVTVHTPPWNRGDFDSPPVRFDGQILQELRNIRGDGHYDELILYVPVSVAQATEVNLSGSFVPPPVGVEARTGGRVLAKGFYVLNLTFDGLAIYEGQVNGPYLVMLDLADGAGLAHRAYYQTAAYVYTQFARPGADFRAPPTVVLHVSASDGRIDRFEIQVPLRVRLAGDYALRATAANCAFCGPTAPVGAWRLVHLDRGNASLYLNVSAVMVSRYAAANPVAFDVAVSGLLGVGGSNTTSVATDITNRSLLEDPYEEPLSLNLTIPATMCGSPRVFALDPADGFLIVASSQATGSVAPFTLPLYNGTFQLLVQESDCTAPGSSLVANVTVAGPTSLDLTAPPAIPPDNDVAVSFPSWTASVVDVHVDWTGLSPYLRFVADAFGNQDGTATAEELRLAVEEATYPWTYVEDLLMDGVAGSANVSVLSVAQGVGDVASSASVVTDLQTTMSTGLPASAGPTHTLVLDVDCCNASALRTLNVKFPAAADGSVSVIRYSPTDFNPLVAPANATVTQTAPGTWSLQFGSTPPSGALTDEFRITIVATEGTRLPAAVIPIAIGVAVVAVAAVVIAVILLRRRKKPKPPPVVQPPHA